MKKTDPNCQNGAGGEFGVNRYGRDLVVGDVHGCFRTLERALGSLAFDPDRDRLFGVGDLVERGPHSSDALEWMERRFCGVTRGNHEDAALTWLEDRLDGSSEPAYGWLRRIVPSAYRRWRDAFARLPLTITIETPHGPVGIVHAESPHRSWTRATELLARDRELDVALLGLSAPPEIVRRYRSRPVDGLRALVHGHEPVREVERTANRWNVDTGAGIASLNRLTLLKVNRPEIECWTFDVDETQAAESA